MEITHAKENKISFHENIFWARNDLVDDLKINSIPIEIHRLTIDPFRKFDWRQCS